MKHLIAIWQQYCYKKVAASLRAWRSGMMLCATKPGGDLPRQPRDNIPTTQPEND
jgi:hypothetical protein